MTINKLFVLSRYIFTAFNFIAILLITSMLGTADFGELSFFRLIIQYLMYAEFGFVQYVFRKRSADGGISNQELSNVFSYLAISVFSFLLVFALLDFNFDIFFSNPLYVAYGIFSVLFGVASKFVIDQLRISGEVTKLVALEFITNGIIYATVIYCWFTKSGSVGDFIAMYSLYIAPYFLFALYSPSLYKKLKVMRFKLELDKNVLYASSMLFLFGFLSLLFSSVDRLIIKYLVGYESLGLYSMAFTVSAGFYMVIQTITWVNMPGFIKAIKNDPIAKSMRDFKQYMFKMQLIYLSVVTLALPFYYFLIKFYNPAYKETFWFFLLLAVYNYVNIFYIYHRTYLLTFEHYRLLNLTLVAGVVFNAGVNLFLVRFGIIELLIVGSIISHVVYMVVVRGVVFRKLAT